MNEVTEEKIKEIFAGDIRGMLRAGGSWKNLLDKYLILFTFLPSILIIILIISINLSNESLISILESIISNGLTVVGVILGLSLGGFILVVSYGNQELIKKAIQQQVGKLSQSNDLQPSYIQKSTAKFGIIVILQFLIFFAFIIFSVVEQIEFTAPLPIAQKVNMAGIFISSALLFFTIGLTYQLILNIFTLSQSNSVQLFIDQYSEIRSKKDESQVK